MEFLCLFLILFTRTARGSSERQVPAACGNEVCSCDYQETAEKDIPGYDIGTCGSHGSTIEEIALKCHDDPSCKGYSATVRRVYDDNKMEFNVKSATPWCMKSDVSNISHAPSITKDLLGYIKEATFICVKREYSPTKGWGQVSSGVVHLTPVNAYMKTPMSSGYEASLSYDGTYDSPLYGNSFARSSYSMYSSEEWLQFDMGTEVSVSRIDIVDTVDHPGYYLNCGSRLVKNGGNCLGFEIRVGSTECQVGGATAAGDGDPCDTDPVCYSSNEYQEHVGTVATCASPMRGRYVTLRLPGKARWVRLEEMAVYGDPNPPTMSTSGSLQAPAEPNPPTMPPTTPPTASPTLPPTAPATMPSYCTSSATKYYEDSYFHSKCTIHPLHWYQKCKSGYSIDHKGWKGCGVAKGKIRCFKKVVKPECVAPSRRRMELQNEQEQVALTGTAERLARLVVNPADLEV